MRRLAVLLIVAASAHARARTGLEVVDPGGIRAEVRGTQAMITASYQVAHDQTDGTATSHLLRLPAGAVVVGATLIHAGRARRLALAPIERVDSEFAKAFEGAPGTAADTWVARIDSTGPDVTFVLGAPVPATMTLELAIAAPTCYLRDARYVAVPAGWERAAPTLPSTQELEAECGNAREGRRWMQFSAHAAAKLPSGDRIATTTARLPVDGDVHIARTDIMLAAALADVPRDLQTIVLVDESRSLTTRQRRVQRELVLGYLRAAPSTRVHVIGYARTSRALLPGWTIAARAASRIERELASPVPRNGSNVEAALAEAARWLAPRSGTRRVVLVTDSLLASRVAQIPPAELARMLPAGVLVHVVVLARDDLDVAAELVEDPAAHLAPLAAATEGIATRIGAGPSTSSLVVDATMLARPIALEDISVTGLGWRDMTGELHADVTSTSCASSLPAGRSCTWWARGTKFAGQIQITGKLWSKRVVRVVHPLGDPGHAIARRLVTASVTDEQLAAKIDQLAYAVTGTTSLLVRWGGTKALAEGAFYGQLTGWRAGFSHHHPSFHDVAPRTGLIGRIDVSAQLAPYVAACNLGKHVAEVTLELTFDEIVDVRVTMADHALAACVEEALWSASVTLPTSVRFQSTRARFGGG